MTATEHAQYLAASSDRFYLLKHLYEAPRRPCNIAEDSSLCRSSVQRVLSGLVDRGWAVKTDGKYHLTTIGLFVVREYDDFIESLKIVDKVRPFFRHLSGRGQPPAPQWFHNAEMTLADSEHSRTPIAHYADSLDEITTETIRGIAPVLSERYYNTHLELINSEIKTEILISERELRTVLGMKSESLFGFDNLDLYTYPEKITFSVTLTDECVFIGAYDNQGRCRGVVESTAPEFLDWAEETYGRYMERSHLIDSESDWWE